MTNLETTLDVPLELWEDGTIRVAGSRVTLDTVVGQFKLGATAEQIQDSFPSLSLRQIYGAIFYYLARTDAVEKYLCEQKQAAEEVRRLIESLPGQAEFRERLRARRRLLIKA